MMSRRGRCIPADIVVRSIGRLGCRLPAGRGRVSLDGPALVGRHMNPEVVPAVPESGFDQAQQVRVDQQCVSGTWTVPESEIPACRLVALVHMTKPHEVVTA